MADVPTTDLPDPDHQTPAGVDDPTIEALGKLSEALETCERARGHLYSFHQLTGSADIELGDAVTAAPGGRARRARGPAGVGADRPQRARRPLDLPDRRGVRRHVLVTLPELEKHARDELAEGRRHLYEARLKQDERTVGRSHHEATPADVPG